MHSIISFNDESGITIDFFRLKPKSPKIVLNAVLKGFSEHETLYLSEELKSRCKSVKIHYTDYESRPENLTFECAFDEFLRRFENYKAEKAKRCTV
ncbi:MAG: hypothetical protein PUF72_05475 [Clostridiales bacterium]|nr:hypothetical protein [Clostridiales bacterium]